MTRWLDPEEQRAWRGLLAMSAQLMARLNRGLQESSGLSLADYDVLVALTDVRDRSLRMTELCGILQWEKSRLSKQVSRMTARGLVRRREVEDDRRGAYVELTDRGRAAIEGAAPEHVELVRRLVIDPLTRRQVEALATIAHRVTDAITAEGAGGAGGHLTSEAG
jgi:DNA-binding MarR family transcriptional regulator